MKKIISSSIIVLVSVMMVSADISIDLRNANTLYTQTGGTSFIVNNRIQLVWNANAPVDAPGQVGTSLMAPGDFILVSFDVGVTGTYPSNMGGSFTDADVGSADINLGYLTLRVFDTDDIAIGSRYFQHDLDVDGALNEYNFQAPSTGYFTESSHGDGLLPAGIQDRSASAYMIIPEPATIGLVGVAGLGLFMARRRRMRW